MNISVASRAALSISIFLSSGSSEITSSIFNHIGLSSSDGSNKTTSLALSLGVKANTSSTKSPWGSITHTQSQFRTSCLATYQINTDLPQPDFHII